MENNNEVIVNENEELVNKLFKKRKIGFIVNISLSLISILGVLALMVFSSFLDNVLEGSRKIVFYIIIGIGLLFWLAFVLIDRLVKLSRKEELYLSTYGSKNEKIFYEEYPNPNDEAELVEGTKVKYKGTKRTFLFNVFSNIGDIYSVICVAFFIVAILFCYFLFPATVVGQCMEPLLYEASGTREADKILAFKNASFTNGDVVVFSYDSTIQASSSSIYDGELLIKRVIACPGQTFQCIDSKIYIDGELLEEEYIKKPYNSRMDYDVTTIIFKNSNREALQAIYDNDNVIPEGYYILLGDNRSVANDSHYFGLVREDQICGVVKFYKNPTGWHKITEN